MLELFDQLREIDRKRCNVFDNFDKRAIEHEGGIYF